MINNGATIPTIKPTELSSSSVFVVSISSNVVSITEVVTGAQKKIITIINYLRGENLNLENSCSSSHSRIQHIFVLFQPDLQKKFYSFSQNFYTSTGQIIFQNK